MDDKLVRRTFFFYCFKCKLMKVFKSTDGSHHWCQFNVKTGLAHVYAETIVAEVLKLKKNGSVLMLGLGGGAIGAKLCDTHLVTALEIDHTVILQSKVFFRHFQKCGLHPKRMKIVHGDAFNPPPMSDTPFDVLVEDVCPCCIGGNSNPIRACTNHLAPDAYLLANFHKKSLMEKVMTELEDLWTIVDVVEANKNFICVAKRVVPSDI